MYSDRLSGGACRGRSQGRGYGHWRGRGRGGSGGSGGSWGHDDRRNLVKKSDHLKVPSRGSSIRGRGRGRARGRGRGGWSDSTVYKPPALRGRRDDGEPWVASKKPVDRVEEERMTRHCEVPAHTRPISAIAMSDQGIFTAGQDCKLKRWKPTQQPDGRYTIVSDSEVPLEEGCYSMICSGGWCFCGLWNGTIQAFSMDGTNVKLVGHQKRVSALLLHQSVLISAGYDQQVRLWQSDQATKTFNCIRVIEDDMPGSIFKLHVLGDNLFIGGMNGVAVCNLLTLRVTKTLPPQKAVTGLLEFQGHVIVAYQDGSMNIFDAEGNVKKEAHPMQAGPIYCIAGLEVGPRVLCGHKAGQVSTIMLPSFDFRTQFQAFQYNPVETVFSTGHDGMFLLGSKSGALQLWQSLP